jgi:hypothetical protein
METIVRLCDFQVAGRGGKKQACGAACVDNQPTPFGLGKASYSVDLCEKHVKEFGTTLAPYIAIAQSGQVKVGRGMRRAIRSVGTETSFTETDVRAYFAKMPNRKVAPTGRLPQALIEEYEKALEDGLVG